MTRIRKRGGSWRYKPRDVVSYVCYWYRALWTRFCVSYMIYHPTFNLQSLSWDMVILWRRLRCHNTKISASTILGWNVSDYLPSRRRHRRRSRLSAMLVFARSPTASAIRGQQATQTYRTTKRATRAEWCGKTVKGYVIVTTLTHLFDCLVFSNIKLLSCDLMSLWDFIIPDFFYACLGSAHVILWSAHLRDVAVANHRCNKLQSTSDVHTKWLYRLEHGRLTSAHVQDTFNCGWPEREWISIVDRRRLGI